MLNRFRVHNSIPILMECASGEWVRYEDAEALQMRVIELEQKLKTQDELKAEFELDCAADCDCKR